jgi:hypothetical protein
MACDGIEQRRGHEPVVDDHLCIPEQGRRSQREQISRSGARTDEKHPPSHRPCGLPGSHDRIANIPGDGLDGLCGDRSTAGWWRRHGV